MSEHSIDGGQMSEVINPHDLGVAGGYIIEDAMQRRIDQLMAENAKLRELCADIYKGFRGVVFKRWSYSSEDFRMYERYMRKMGIEVD